MFSRSIHTIPKGKLFFFFMPSSIPLCKCSMVVLYTHLPIDTWAASVSRRLYKMLQWTQGCLYSFKLVFWVPLDISPKVGLLGQKSQIHFKLFEVSPYCFPQWRHQSTLQPTVQKGSPFSTSLPALAVWFIDDGHSDRCEMVSHRGFNLHCSEIIDVEHLVMCLQAIWISSLEKYLVRSFAQFLIGLFFLCWVL